MTVLVGCRRITSRSGDSNNAKIATAKMPTKASQLVGFKLGLSVT